MNATQSVARDVGHVGVWFADAAAQHGDLVATRIRAGNGWVTQTYAALAEQVSALAARLIELGVAPGDRVAIFAPNRPEWTACDLACASVRAISVPLYATSTADQVRYLLADSGCVLAFVEGSAEVAKIVAAWPDLPALTRVVSFAAVDEAVDPRVSSLAAELAAAPSDVSTVAARLDEAKADEVSSLVYTSGTTGNPKGVMLTHRGFTHQVDVLSRFFDITPADHSLCFLPLSHALERAWTYVVLSNGCMNTYVPDAKQVADMLVAAQPTMLVSVPRLYEKVFLTAHQKVADSAAKRTVFAWALRVGGRNQRAYRKGQRPSAVWRAQLRLADKLVFAAVREAMGGPKTVLACGGAPLRQEIEEFFSACGLLVLQGYGLTETSPLLSFPSPANFKFGTVGRVMPGGEVRLGADGEILYRGPNLMVGYWNNPEATAAAIVDGWLHTGDVGYVDTDGYLVITDRIKDLIITSTGKNIAPAPIEGLLASDPLFEYSVLLGDNRPYLTLLVSPSLPALEGLAKQLQLTWEHRADLISNPALIAEMQRRVGVLTARLARHEQIRDLRILIEEFTQDNGLLTPTLKVKRREVEKRFAGLIEEMYGRIRPKG